METTVPSVFIYEYPTLGGPPLGTFDVPAVDLEDPAVRRVWAACVGCLAVPEDNGSLRVVGGVFRYTSKHAQWGVHILYPWDGPSIYLQREEVATQLLRDGTQFRAQHAEEPWVDLMEVLLWFQYESDYRLAFLADEIATAFLPPAAHRRVVMLCPMLITAIERNHRRERQAARRAFATALPRLLPGLQVAKQKPGHAWKKGYADFFLTDQQALLPTQFLLRPVCQARVQTLRQAIQGYQSPRGYFIAPGLEADVVLDGNMVLVPFGRDAAQPSAMREGSDVVP